MRTFARVIVWALAALGLAALAAGAFMVSYGAIREVWITLGAGSADAADIVPLLIDGFIVMVSLVGMANALSGRPIAYPMALVGAAALVSVALNIAHAERTWGASLLAAVPPLVLLAATELFVRELRHVLTRARDDEAADEAAAPADGRQLALIDRDNPERTMEFVRPTSAPPLVIHNEIHNETAARVGASAEVQHADSADSAEGADADLAALATAGASTRAMVRAAWEQREFDGGQHIKAIALAYELTALTGRRVPESTVRAELSQCRNDREKEPQPQ